MKFTTLGRTGLKVSQLCLGTMNFGAHAEEADAYQIMDTALDLDINFFDTANRYGGKIGEGITEQIIGRWFAQGGGRREKVVIATKVYGSMTENNWPNTGGLSALSIKRACEDSLRRLQTDYIDLYQMHHVDRSVPWEEIWQAMEQLVQEGKVLYIGSSNFAGWHIAKANEAAKRRNFLGLVSEQCLYNPTSRMVEMDVLPACEDYGLGVIPWSPLAGGVLGGVLKKESEGRRSSESVQKRVDELRDQIQQWEDFCDDLGEEPGDVAIAWLLRNPVVSAPIIGPRTLDQLTGVTRALEIKLDDAAMQRIDAIWPGYKTSPEHFAW